MSDFKKLNVWHKAHALALGIDRMSKDIRATQYASLRNQIFRAALSIPANIAEGRRKTSEKEFARFLGIAVGSSSELESSNFRSRRQAHLRERIRFVCESNDRSSEDALRLDQTSIGPLASSRLAAASRSAESP
ncbi:MAG: four helix bundle protein [Gemmatimonadaceae bacterium]